LAAVSVFTEKKSVLQPLNIWKQLRWPVYVALSVLSAGLLQIRCGFIPMPEQQDTSRLGKHDFTLDLFGWNQLAAQFDEIVETDRKHGHTGNHVVLFTGNWFPAGQLDFYLGFSKGRTLLVDGDLEQQHQYTYINEWRGGLDQVGETVYYLSTSRYFYAPSARLRERYQVDEPVTLVVERGGKPVYMMYVFRLRAI
jgi:hypothetical protein